MGKLKEVELEWLIHYKCNYRCPYCFFDGMWEEIEPRNQYLPLEKWFKVWYRIFEKYEKVRILITGGEPLIYLDFIELVEELSKYCAIGFDTNLSCSVMKLRDFVKKVVAENIDCGLSFHPLFAEYDSFLNKALFLKENGYNVRVYYVTYPPQLGRLKYFQHKFVKKGLNFVPQPFRGRYNGKIYPEAYTEEEKALIYNITEDLDVEFRKKINKQMDQVKSEGRLCRAGQVYARVDTDGTVYRCGCDATGSANKPIGNFFDANFELLDKPTPCEEKICPCEFRWLVKEN